MPFAFEENKITIGITNGLNASGVAKLVVKVFQDYVEPIINTVNLGAFNKHILRSDVGDPNLRGNGKNSQVSSLRRHTNLLD